MEATAERTSAELMQEHGITASWEAKGFNVRDDDGWEHNAYTVTFRRGKRQLTTPFNMGLGLKGGPAALDVLDSLLSDASAADEDFEGFCGNMGYDTDSRKAERIYKACQATERKLRRFLDDSYDAFMSAERL